MVTEIPDRGDVLLVDLNPSLGNEQRNVSLRPCVVISGKAYNAASRLVVVCPLTKRRKGRAFEVPATFQDVDGAVLVEHVRSIDRVTRNARIIGTLDEPTMAHLLGKLQALLFQ